MPDPPLLLGHRGARAKSAPPENTFAAFDVALDSGCDGFEFDVRLTLDKEAVICHDPTHAGVPISSAKSSDCSGLCTFDKVLARYHSRAFLDIELKVPGLAGRVLLDLTSTKAGRGYVISSFLPDVIVEVYTAKPDVPLGLICETEQQLARAPDLPVGWVMSHYSLTTSALVQRLHRQQKKVLVWTVNRPAQMLNFVQHGVDGLISDNPALLVKTVRRCGK
jgi:glycerophosphoryl diester phosphodiesterase